MDPTFIELFASLFSRNGDGDQASAHQQNISAAMGFAAAVRMFEAGLKEGESLEAKLRERAKELDDLADLVAASRGSTAPQGAQSRE